MAGRERTFDEYWVSYVRFHADVRVRKLQFAATTVGLGVAVTGVLTRRPSLVVAASAFAFAPTWLASALWGPDAGPLRGQPAFRVAAAVKAWRMTLQGTLQAEVERHVETSRTAPDSSHDQRIPRPNMVTDHTLH